MLCRQTAFHVTARAKELTRHTWPGNIREPQNVVKRILATLKGIKIDTTIIQLQLEGRLESDTNLQVRNAEIEDIRQAMVLSRGKHAEAAKILGISRSTLWRRLKKITGQGEPRTPEYKKME